MRIVVKKRIAPSDIIVEEFYIESADEYDKKIDKIRERYNDLEISLQELVDSILQKTEKTTFQIKLYETIGENRFRVIRYHQFLGDDRIIEMLR